MSKALSESIGWALWCRSHRADEADCGPLGWSWSSKFGKDYDLDRPGGACQIAVFRTRRAARAAAKMDGYFAGRLYVKKVRVAIFQEAGR